MDKAWAGRFFRSLCAGLAVSAWLSFPHVAPDAGASGMIAGNYQLNWDKTVDKTVTGTTDTTKLKQLVELKYTGFFSPVVANSLILKVEQEVNSDTPDVIRWQPQLELGFKGSVWSIAAGAKRLDESTDEPGKNPKTTDNYYAELFYMPPKRVPDLKAKYTLDKDFEEGTTDTAKSGLTLSSVYNPNSWLGIKGDYTKNQLEDRLKADSDTQDDKITGTFNLRYIVSDKVKYDTQYLAELSRGSTLLSDGSGDVPGSTKEETTQTWKNALSFRPFTDTSLDGIYDTDLKKNKVTGEQNVTVTSKAAVTQQILSIYALRGEFARTVTEVRNSADDNRKTEDTWTGEFKARLAKQLDFSFKVQDKDTTEDHEDPAKNRTSGSWNGNATWSGEFSPFWKAAASWDLTDTYDMGAKITTETKYSVRTTFDFKAIHLVLDPTYDVTIRDDLVKAETSDIRDFKFKLGYLLVGTRTMEAKLDHTYGRKTDSLLSNIQRTDTTNGNLLWKAMPGWLFGFDVTRSATDTSGDDSGPDITTTLGFKADCSADMFMFSTSYKYDIKTLTDDSEVFDAKAGWRAPKWDVTLTYNYKKTFSTEINEGYAITLTFKYNL